MVVGAVDACLQIKIVYLLGGTCRAGHSREVEVLGMETFNARLSIEKGVRNSAHTLSSGRHEGSTTTTITAVSQRNVPECRRRAGDTSRAIELGFITRAGCTRTSGDIIYLVGWTIQAQEQSVVKILWVIALNTPSTIPESVGGALAILRS
jgi:hypothetical protein